MSHTFRKAPLLLVSFAILSISGSASVLTLNGESAADVMMNDTIEIEVTGTPGLPVTLLVDVDAGPTFVFGQSLPLGFSPFVLMLPLGNLSSTGKLTFSVPAPSIPTLHKVPLYMLAVVHDPSFVPHGFDFSNGATLKILDRNVSMAGRSLAQYPFFEVVRSVSVGKPIEFAIDPNQHSFLVGQQADVYVVASKTKGEWIANNSLLDVRGAPTPFTFAAGTIQANTFTLDPGSLNSDPGDTGLGVAYDVVIDVNQNAVLDAVDLADGYGEEAGFYVIRSFIAQGPLSVKEVTYSGGAWLGQNLYYPTNISQLGQLPLVVVSHGNGHNYQWYDHMGYHLASYGYIVVSHQNNTQPGSHTAALTTLSNTEYIIANQGTIDGGALNGHLDSSNIVWIGHSRGGDGVVRAYDDIVDGDYSPVNFSIGDIKLISSIAPVDFGGFGSSHPHSANFHVWVGQADNDVWGCASADSAQWYNIHDRAEQIRQSISLYGVGHGDFHDGGGSSVASGPCLIGRASTHLIMKGYLLPLIRHHIEGSIPARDFLWRQYEDFHPRGAPVTNPCVEVNLTYRDGDASGKRVIDDFQTGSSIAVSSSGGTVSAVGTIPREGNMDDGNTSFTHIATDLFNGFTNDGENPDNSRGMIFSYASNSSVSFSVIPQYQDLTEFNYVSFRCAQASRHPDTTAVLGDLTFTVTLEDAAGVQSSINIGAYGGGVEEPYQRTGCGSGAGWNSEFETVRIRLTDFLVNGSALNLREITGVIFQFGPSFGDAQGRLGFDDLEFTVE